MIRNLTIYIAIIASFISLRANDFTPDMMPNVNVTNRYEFVSDPGNLLSPATKDAVNRRLWDLRQQTSVEAVVAIPPSIGETTIEDWSEQLFTLWGIGKKDKDNGVLLVIAPEQRRARITTGYGVEGVLPDISCKNIINSAIIPNMREGDINRAVDDATNLVSRVLTDPAVAEEIRSRQPDNHSGAVNALSGEVIWKFIRIVATCAFLFSLVMFVRYLFKGRKKERQLPQGNNVARFLAGIRLDSPAFSWLGNHLSRFCIPTLQVIPHPETEMHHMRHSHESPQRRGG